MHILNIIRERLERAWLALIDEPRDAAGVSGRADIILTGPLPKWMHQIFIAKARELHRPLADVIYVALRVEARRLIAESAEADTTAKGSNDDRH